MDLSGFAKYPSLRDAAVFVAGGGSGIGAAIVEAFVDQGAKVAFVDIAAEESRRLRDALAAQYAGRRSSSPATSPTSPRCKRPSRAPRASSAISACW